MTMDRRTLLSAGTGLGVIAATRPALATAGPREAHALEPGAAPSTSLKSKLQPGSPSDQTTALQAAIDAAAARGQPLHLPAGALRTGALRLPANTKLIGASGLTVLEFTGGPSFLTAKDASGVTLQDIVFDGGLLPLDPEQSDALLRFEGCTALILQRVEVRRALLNGISLERCSGRISDCTVRGASQAITSNNATGLEIAHNHIADCANNGILVWRDKPGEDGTIVSSNRIEGIKARNGGSGEYGNGINVFRADGVLVSGNRIAGCAYSAVRGNAASNIQIISNSCEKLGEVAIYAEFGFQGAIISNNLIDHAATGISVTNFSEGGRLAVVQGNLIRNLVRRENDPEDKRGEGITLEADTLVTGNIIESAATCGILVGWGKYMRDCMVTQNMVRACRTGILISSDDKAGSAMISGNMISGSHEGAVRMMDYGKPTGADLAQPGAAIPARLTITGNVATAG